MVHNNNNEKTWQQQNKNKDNKAHDNIKLSHIIVQ